MHGMSQPATCPTLDSILALVLPQDDATGQDRYAVLVSENAALRLQMKELRSDYDALRQDVDGIKQRLYMSEPMPLFGAPSKVRLDGHTLCQFYVSSACC